MPAGEGVERVTLETTRVSDTGMSDTVTPPSDERLTNLRVTARARDIANEIASALGMDQRALVEGLLELVVGVVRKEKAKGVSSDYLREAVLGRRK